MDHNLENEFEQFPGARAGEISGEQAERAAEKELRELLGKEEKDAA